MNLPELPPGIVYDTRNNDRTEPFGVLWEDKIDGDSQYAILVRMHGDTYGLYMADKGHGIWDSVTPGFSSPYEALCAGVARAWVGAWK